MREYRRALKRERRQARRLHKRYLRKGLYLLAEDQRTRILRLTDALFASEY